jgi:hypothetical protein
MFVMSRLDPIVFMEFRYRLIIFLVSFSIGMLYVYTVTPHRRAIVKYPTPFNAGKIVYKDDTDGTCYTYKAQQTDCPVKGAVPQPFTNMATI